jgi:hypothetical protein
LASEFWARANAKTGQNFWIFKKFSFLWFFGRLCLALAGGGFVATIWSLMHLRGSQRGLCSGAIGFRAAFLVGGLNWGQFRRKTKSGGFRGVFFCVFLCFCWDFVFAALLSANLSQSLDP